MTGQRVLTGVAIAAALVLGAFLVPSSAERPKCMGESATIVGTAGSERLVGTNTKDVIVARGGHDYILGKAARDLICAGSGRDHIDAGEGRDRVAAGGGNDHLVGGSRTELLNGGGGDDVFFTRSGRGGTIEGGEGSDWLTFVDRGCKRAVKVDLSHNEVRYRNCAGTATRIWTVRSVQTVEGGPGRDSFIGNKYPNRLRGGEGRDELWGKAGNDSLHGGDGYDMGRGGAGSDTCFLVEWRRSC